MPRLNVAYDPAQGPFLRISLIAELQPGQWGPRIDIDAVVDSGATTTSIQQADADALGVTAALRKPGPQVTFANGAQAPTELSAVKIAAAVFNPQAKKPFGPSFLLEPTIKAAGDRLLGTSDFFEIFEVSFWPGPAGSRFSLVV